MTDVIRIKRRTSPAGVPSALANAELAYNEASDILYYGKGGTAGAAASIIPVAGSGAFLPLSGGTLSGPLTINSSNALQFTVSAPNAADQATVSLYRAAGATDQKRAELGHYADGSIQLRLVNDAYNATGTILNVTRGSGYAVGTITLGGTAVSVSGTLAVTGATTLTGALQVNNTITATGIIKGNQCRFLQTEEWAWYNSAAGVATLWMNGNKFSVNTSGDIFLVGNNIWFANVTSGNGPKMFANTTDMGWQTGTGNGSFYWWNNAGTTLASLFSSGIYRVPNEFQSQCSGTWPVGLRLIKGNYGTMLYSDGSTFYFLLTASGDQYGGYNSLRPLSINLSSGGVTMGNGMGLSGGLTVDSLSVTGTSSFTGTMTSGAINAQGQIYAQGGPGRLAAATDVYINGLIVNNNGGWVTSGNGFRATGNGFYCDSGNLTINSGSITSSGAIQANNGAITTLGSGAMFQLGQRTGGSGNFGWYAQSDWAYLWHAAAGNMFQYTSTYFTPCANNNVNCGMNGQAWSNVWSYGYPGSSGRAEKQDITDAPQDALARVMALRTVDFRWRKGADTERVHRGWIADEVAAVMGEEWGGYQRSDDGHEAVDKGELTAVLWQAVRELAAEVAALRGRP